MARMLSAEERLIAEDELSISAGVRPQAAVTSLVRPAMRGQGPCRDPCGQEAAAA